MRNFARVAVGIDVAPALAQLAEHPSLWNAHTHRRDAPGSPHTEMSDIWVRFRDRAELTSPARFAEPHNPVWYPAIAALPALRPIIFDVMRAVEATRLGGVLITRIPPGGRIAEHHDRGGWHAEFYTTKVYVPLAANSRCVNRCEDEAVVMDVGEAWTFDNLKLHSVENNGASDRITLIVCMRTD